jgi:hypothetical protein
MRWYLHSLSCLVPDLTMKNTCTSITAQAISAQSKAVESDEEKYRLRIETTVPPANSRQS